MISKKHFTKSMATILFTLTFLTTVSPCTFAEEKNFNKKTTKSTSTTRKILLAGTGAIGLITIGHVVYVLSKDPTKELLKAIKSKDSKKVNEILCDYYNVINFDSPIKSENGRTLNDIARNLENNIGLLLRTHIRMHNTQVCASDRFFLHCSS